MKIRRIDYSPDEMIAGIAGQLDPLDFGVYWMICTLIYSRGGPIDDDPVWISRIFRNTNPRTVRAAIERLVEAGKVERNGAELMVNRCRTELERALNRTRKASENGAKGGRPSKKNKGLEKAGGLSGEKLTINYQLTTTNIDSSLRSESISPPLRLSPPDLDEDDEVPFLRDDPAPEPPPPAEPSPEPDPEPAPAPEPTTKPKPKPAKPTTAAKRGERLTAEEPPPEWLDWAREAGHRAPEREWLVFRDYWIAQPGQKGIKLDWFATWRNWIRRDLGGGTAPPRRSRRAGMAEPSPAEAFRRTPEEIEEIEKAIAEW